MSPEGSEFNAPSIAARGTIRDMMRFHARTFAAPADRGCVV